LSERITIDMYPRNPGRCRRTPDTLRSCEGAAAPPPPAPGLRLLRAGGVQLEGQPVEDQMKALTDFLARSPACVEDDRVVLILRSLSADAVRR